VAIGCHRARAAALGWDATYMTYDPSALADVRVTVTDEPDGVLVGGRTRGTAMTGGTIAVGG